MGFVNYLLLGVLSLAAGWALQVYVINKKPDVKDYREQGMMHPTIRKYLAIFFVIMMGVSWALGRFVLGHETLDIAYILVNSAVATVVFGFGLSPEQNRMNIPD